MYILAKVSKGHFKRNILGKMILIGNKCICLCPKKCILSQIPISCQEMCFEQLECFTISSITMSLGELKSKLQPNLLNFGHNYFFQNSPNSHNLFQRPPMGANIFSIYYEMYCQNFSSMSNKNTTNVSVKKGLWSYFYLAK